ncbi:MAG: alkaline shock response membrane anchor protein AmaP [Firmicutes bacterium]|nr:alkaline shock response membrane anchor protein AmaP [Bacillota bacterium]
MRAVDRVIVILFSLILFVISVLLAAVAAGWNPAAAINTFVTEMVQTADFETTVLAIVLFLLSVYFFTLGLRGRRKIRAIVQETSLGTVRIALKAVENLVQRAARQVHGIREVDTEVKPGQAGLEVSLEILVAPDMSIPEVSEQVQRRVESYVQETVGVNVTNVLLTVRNIVNENRARVE